MRIGFDRRFDMEVVEIFPGEYHATRASRIISTILGSCIAVALFDARETIAGLNHFMLPGDLANERFYLSKSGKYGMFAMELLINEMIKLGAKKKNFTAKVFGGGKVLKDVRGVGFGSIPESNITFALAFLQEEGIPVVARDVGGTSGRRVLYFTADARVLVKKLSREEITPLEKEEDDYLSSLRTEIEKKQTVTLF